MIDRISDTSGELATKLPIALAVRAGDFVFVSGQVALREFGSVTGDIADQTEVTLTRCKTVLERADCTFADVVKVNVWLADPRDFGPFNAVFAKHFEGHPPARSVVVSQLVVDGKVEIEMTAYKPLAAGA